MHLFCEKNNYECDTTGSSLTTEYSCLSSYIVIIILSVLPNVGHLRGKYQQCLRLSLFLKDFSLCSNAPPSDSMQAWALGWISFIAVMIFVDLYWCYSSVSFQGVH